MPEQLGDWNSNDDKAKAIRDVLRHFVGCVDADYDAVSERCVADNDFARAFFREKGKIEIPPKARVVFLRNGDHAGVNGSLLLEIPPAGAVTMPNPEILDAYVRSDIGQPTPSTSEPRRWANIDERAAAIVDVVRYLAATPNDAEQALRDDQFSRNLFLQGPGKIEPPARIKIIFLPPG